MSRGERHEGRVTCDSTFGPKDMKLLGAIIATVVGVFLSGRCAVWGACLAGYKLNAGYPFPDVKAIVLFLTGAFAVPLVVAYSINILRNRLSYRLDANRLSIPFAVLLLAPLISLAVGFTVQSRRNMEREQRAEFRSRQEDIYFRLASQVAANPSIVLRERWFEEASDDDYAYVAARRKVFEDSFRPDRLVVPYTGEQLQELSTKARENGLLVVSHPNCRPDLIESMWSAVLASREAWLIGAMIDNPATPRPLFEAYRAERLKANREVSGWIDREIERRIEDTEQGGAGPPDPKSQVPNP